MMEATPIDVDYSKSEVRQFYNGKTIFITGASGFLGRLLVEKLLRTSDLKHIYILLREKKDQSPQERFKELFNVPAFEILRSIRPDFKSKISMLEGDLTLPCLGLSENSKSIIKNEVNCIFHAAATVRFDEKLRKAIYTNARPTRDLLQLAKEVKNLESYVHISTAYSNCIRKDIDEIFYDPIVKSDKLLEIIDGLDDNVLDDITPILLQDNPNTYVFTKAMAEDFIKEEGQHLPIAIVRPSIVISTFKEPLPGWIDNLYGATSLLVGVALGLVRTVHGKGSHVADLVPADFVINTIIASGWDIGQSCKREKLVGNESTEREKRNPKIYNYTSGAQNPITWQEYKDLAKEFGLKIPSPLIVWHSTFCFQQNYYINWLLAFLFQTVPAYIVDFFARCFGKSPMFVRVAEKISKLCDSIAYFICREWNFKNDNVQKLFAKLNDTDRKLYNFDIGSMSWHDYFSTYLVGARVYLLKDPLDTIPQGKRKLLAVKIGHYILMTIVCLVFLKFLMVIYNLF